MHGETAPEYLEAHVRELLAEDERIAELALDVEVDNDVVTVAGAVSTQARLDAIPEVISEHYPDLRVENRTVVVGPGRPAEGPR